MLKSIANNFGCPVPVYPVSLLPAWPWNAVIKRGCNIDRSAVVNTCHQQQKPLWTPNTSIGLLAGKGPWVHLYMIFVDFLGCIRNKLTLELCKIFKCDVSCCKLQIHMQGSKMALTNSWNSETRKPANLRRKRTRPHENPRFNFQCFDSFSDPSLRRTKWKMEFTITACRGCHMNWKPMARASQVKDRASNSQWHTTQARKWMMTMKPVPLQCAFVKQSTTERLGAS